MLPLPALLAASSSGSSTGSCACSTCCSATTFSASASTCYTCAPLLLLPLLALGLLIGRLLLRREICAAPAGRASGGGSSSSGALQQGACCWRCRCCSRQQPHRHVGRDTLACATGRRLQALVQRPPLWCRWGCSRRRGSSWGGAWLRSHRHAAAASSCCSRRCGWRPGQQVLVDADEGVGVLAAVLLPLRLRLSPLHPLPHGCSRASPAGLLLHQLSSRALQDWALRSR